MFVQTAALLFPNYKEQLHTEVTVCLLLANDRCTCIDDNIQNTSNNQVFRSADGKGSQRSNHGRYKILPQTIAAHDGEKPWLIPQC